MADSRTPSGHGPSDDADAGTPPEAVAGGSQWHPLTTAALIGGAIAATAGVYLGTKALARRNAGKDGKRVNAVMATAITASNLVPKPKSGRAPSAAEILVGDKEPAVAPEPTVASEPKA